MNPTLQMGKLRQEGVREGARSWPGCTKVSAVLRTMARGIGHRGPLPADEDAEVSRTSGQPKVTQVQMAGRSHAQACLRPRGQGSLALQGSPGPEVW